MTITPIDESAVLKAVQMMLKASATIANLGLGDANITRGEFINQDPAACPWIGIYAVGEQYVSRTLGLGAGFRMQHMGIVVVLQMSDYSSGAACQDKLGQLKQAVISCLLSDPTLGGTVQVIDNFTVSYANAQAQANTPNFQSAVVNCIGLGPVTVS